MEARYRKSARHRTARQTRTAAIVAAVMFLLFALSDYALLGSTGAFYALLTLRLTVVAACTVLVLAVMRRPEVVDWQWPVNLTIFVGLTGIILIVPLRPETIATQIPAVIVAVLAQYLFVPNRVPWALAQSLYLSSGFFVATAVWAPLPPGQMLSLFLLLILVNTIGLMTLLRLSHLQREQFAMLLDERETNQRLSKEIDRRRRLEQELLWNARIDELTGLNNRRHFFELADREVRVCHATRIPFSLCIFDLDHFKAVNDSFGHAGGDEALVAVAAACQKVVRDQDVLARLGGEEFVVALPGTAQDAAREVAERIRTEIAAIRFPKPLEEMRLTATLGVAEVATSRETAQQALQRADAALYTGKRAGRNRVVVASPVSGGQPESALGNTDLFP